jgi:hypothetical protein
MVFSAAAASIAVGLSAPAQAATPAVSSTTTVTSVISHTPNAFDRGRRRHHRFNRFRNFDFGFSPFLFGGSDFAFSDLFGGGRFGGGGCEIFLETGDINSYILCRVG